MKLKKIAVISFIKHHKVSSLIFTLSTILWTWVYSVQYTNGRLGLVDFSLIDLLLVNTCQGSFARVPLPMSDVVLYNHFGVHMTPILLFLLPIKCLFNTPHTTYFLQAFLFSISIFPITKILNFLNYDKTSSFLTYIFFLVLPYSIMLQLTNFHYEVFYIPLGLLLLFYYISNQKLKMVLTFFFYLLIKEDAPLYMMALFLFDFLFFSKSKKVSFFCFMVSVLYFLICITFAIPIFSVYSSVSQTAGAFRHFLFAPVDFISNIPLINPYFGFEGSRSFLAPFYKFVDSFSVEYLLSFLKGSVRFLSYFLFLPLFEKRIWAPLGLCVFIHGVSLSDGMNNFYSYHSAILIPFLMTGYLITLKKLRSDKLIKVIISLSILISLLFPPKGNINFKFFNDKNLSTQRLKINSILKKEKLRNEVLCISDKYWPYLPYEYRESDLLDRHCLLKDEVAYIYHSSDFLKLGPPKNITKKYIIPPFSIFIGNRKDEIKKNLVFWTFFTKEIKTLSFESNKKFTKMRISYRTSNIKSNKCINAQVSINKVFHSSQPLCKGHERRSFDIFVDGGKGENLLDISLGHLSGEQVHIDYFQLLE